MKKKILIIVIIFVVIIALLSVNFFKFKNKKSGEVPEFQNRAEELVKNNYILSYLLYGDVKTSDSFTEIDHIKYYYVNDPELNEIKAMNDILILMEETLLEEPKKAYMNKLSNKKNNRYIEEDGMLFVAKSDKTCLNIEKYNEANYELKDNKMLIKAWNNLWALKTDNTYYLMALSYICLED